MQNRTRICAVVVTYNRKELLLRCLNALKNQSYSIDHIVVINNASQDGTIEFLSMNNWINSDYFTLINLEINQGGAGGFYEGIRFAVRNAFDYIWLMDDDGFPSENCLEKLSPYLSDNCYIGPLVLDTETKDKLSFALRVPGTIDIIDFYSQMPDELIQDNVIKNIVLPFNGTLIARSLVDKIGYPNKDYFIWGDEKEYTYRAIKEKANVFSVVDAIFYHPADSSISKAMFFNKLRFNYTESNIKLYCFCRNSIAILTKHFGFHYSAGFFLKTTWFYLFTDFNIRKLLFSWRAMWHGFLKDFRHHRKYLQ